MTNTLHGFKVGERVGNTALETADDARALRLPLYLHDGTISNWPGSIKFPAVGVHTGRHNMARTRTDAYFVGPDGYWWHGTCYGENTEVFHARRTKERAK